MWREEQFNLGDTGILSSCAKAKAATMPLAIFAVAMSVYLTTMAPTVYNLDSAELATGAYTLGIVHPPGYPTYLLVGKLFTFLPVGNVGYRLNLMSGFFGALTVTLVYFICRQLSCSVIASTTAALLLAFSYFFWTGSVVAEVYTLHTFLLGMIVLFLLLWRQRRSPKLLFVLAFVYGISFGSHTSSLLLAPGIIAFLFLHGNIRHLLTRLSGMLLYFLLGLLVFAYLPIRYSGGALNLTGWFDALGNYHTANLTTWEGFRWFVSGALFRPMMFAYDTAGLTGQWLQYIKWLWGTFAGVGIVLGAVGMLEWAKTRPKDALATGLLFLAPLLFFLDYAAIDKETMLLSTYVIWSLWVGAGSEVLFQELSSVGKGVPIKSGRSSASVIAHACLLGMPLLALVLNYQYANVSWDWRSREWAAEILEVVDDNAIVLGWWTDVQPMIYLQQVEGIRPDVFILSRMAIGPVELEQLLSSRIEATPVYSADFDPLLNARYDFQPQSRCYRLLPRLPMVEQVERGDTNGD